MGKPLEERRDRGRHFAPEADLDWRPRDKMITYQKRQNYPQLGSAKFMGKKFRRVVLPGPASGIKQDLSKNRFTEELNAIINNDIFTKENTATYPSGRWVICTPAEAHNEHSSRNAIRMAESCASERLSPAKEPFIPCENEDGFFLPELFPYKGAPPKRPQLKRKLTTAEAKSPASNRTLLIGEPPSVGKLLSHHGNRVTNCDTTKANLDLTDENDPKRQRIDSENSSFVFPDRPWVVRSRGVLNLNGLTGVQVQILDFLSENNRKPIMLAGYKELLQLELTRVEEALALMRTVESAR